MKNCPLASPFPKEFIYFLQARYFTVALCSTEESTAGLLFSVENWEISIRRGSPDRRKKSIFANKSEKGGRERRSQEEILLENPTRQKGKKLN